MLASNGVRRDSSSKSSSVSSTPTAARHRDQMDDRVRRAAERQHGGDRVVERRRRQDVATSFTSSHTISTIRRPGVRRHPRVPRVGGRDRRRARAASRPAPPPRSSSSTPCPSSCSARASGRCRSRSPASPAAVIAPARRSAQYFQMSEPDPSVLPPQFPRSIGPAGMKIAGRSIAAAPISSAGRRLVAAAHQHRAVDRIGAQQLLGLHRQQVAVEHRRRLLERLRQRHRRHLDREPAGLPDAALDLLDALLEMRVARVDVAPGVDDRDHRLARGSPRRRSPSARCATGGRTTAGPSRRTSGGSGALRVLCVARRISQSRPEGTLQVTGRPGMSCLPCFASHCSWTRCSTRIAGSTDQPGTNGSRPVAHRLARTPARSARRSPARWGSAARPSPS